MATGILYFFINGIMIRSVFFPKYFNTATFSRDLLAMCFHSFILFRGNKYMLKP
jgi:hypothetical protein